jgi:hypothetical protein
MPGDCACIAVPNMLILLWSKQASGGSAAVSCDVCPRNLELVLVPVHDSSLVQHQLSIEPCLEFSILLTWGVQELPHSNVIPLSSPDLFAPVPVLTASDALGFVRIVRICNHFASFPPHQSCGEATVLRHLGATSRTCSTIRALCMR